MKRVKIMLVAITMIAAVGGTLAFKAAKVPAQRVYTCSPQFTCQLTLPTITNITTTDDPNAFRVTTLYTITLANINGAACDNGSAPCTIQPSTFVTAEQ